MDQKLIDKIARAEVVAFKCIMAVKFLEAVTGKEQGKEFWAFSQNFFGEVACLLWCHLFNSYSGELHCKNIFDGKGTSFFGTQFTYQSVQARLASSINLDSQAYSDFRKEIVSVRDKYIAHKEATLTPLKFPHINLAKIMCLEIRDIFAELFAAAYQFDSNNFEYDKWHGYYQSQTRQMVLRRCEQDLRNAGISG